MMADNQDQDRSQVSSSKKLKVFTSANDNDDSSSSCDNQDFKKTESASREIVSLLFPNSTHSPEESVFSINHILESIFADLDRQSLLNCRLVCRRWLYFSSNALQKVITLTFEHSYKPSASHQPADLLLKNQRDRRDRPIQDLITLMKNSNNFPCSSFSFKNYRSERKDKFAQQFFNAHGPLIKKIQFEGDFHLTDLKILLLTQAPNLEQLLLHDLEFEHIGTEPPSETEYDVDWGWKEFLFSEENTMDPNPTKPVLENLKMIKMLSESCDFPGIFLRQLLQCSPNLVEVEVSPDYLHHPVKPVNRLHLLKKLEFEMSQNNVSLLEMIAQNHECNLGAVQQIHFDSEPLVGEEFSSRAAAAISKILKGCSATCHTLRWDGFLEGFKMPPMSGVRHLSFWYHGEDKVDICGRPINVFSEGVGLRDTFPNLRSLEVFSECYIQDARVQNLFGYNCVIVPVPSVTKVTWDFLPNRQNILPILREIFPNAVLLEGENENGKPV